MIYSWDIMEVIAMDYVGREVTDPSKIDNTEMQNILNELNRWCMNYRGFINQVFSEQVTMEEKVTKLFWVIKKVAESQLDVTESYNELYQFVINYFDSHDFQTMVNNKLDQMAQDGTLESLINDRILGDIKNDISSVSARVSTLESDMSNQKVLVGKLTGWSLSGKQIDWFGDSIMAGEMPGGTHTYVDKPIPTLIAEATGATCINHAKSGATICSGDWDVKIIDQVKSADLSKSDYVVIEGGINDYLLNYVISAPSNSPSYNSCFEVGLLGIFNYIADVNPTATIIMLTMFPNNALYNGSLGHDGQHFKDYNRKIMEVCRSRCIRCINMTTNSINYKTFSAVSSDGTHFDQTGYNILANHLLNAMETAATEEPVYIGNNMLDGMFPLGNIPESLKSNPLSTLNSVRLDKSNNIAYSVVGLKCCAGTYTIRFKMCVVNGQADVYFGCETYQRLGGIRGIKGSPGTTFATHIITITPTDFSNRVLFLLDTEKSTCDFVIITDITMCKGDVPCEGDTALENRANVQLSTTYFNKNYPLEFRQRDRYISFNGPVQTTKVVPARTTLVTLSNYNFAKGRFCPPSAIVFASGLDGTVYPLLFDLSTYKLENLKEIPANTNLGITGMIDLY